MDSRQRAAGVKVTYIETQFVTSDAAGFKDLVQRLTGKSPTATAGAAAPAAAPPHRPPACRAAGAGMTTTTAAGAAAGRQCDYGYRPAPAAGEVMRYPAVASRAPKCQQEELLVGKDDDFSDLFYVGAIDQRRRHGLNNGGYGDFVHY